MCSRIHHPSQDRPHELRRLGSFFEVDSQGFVIKSLSKAAIQDAWRPVVDDVAGLFSQHLGASLHSVYVRGSTAKGMAIEHMSDVDCIAAVTTITPVPRLYSTSITKCCRILQDRYPFVSKVEMSVGSVEQARITRPMQIVLQTQAICVQGQDLSNEFLPARVGRDASVAFRGLSKNIETCVRALQNEMTAAQTRVRCAWIMKKILRTAFELVMEREWKYTRDLYLCYESFSKYYAVHRTQMYRVLELAVNPADDPSVVCEVLGDLKWLLDEVVVVFGVEDGVIQ